MSLYLLYYRAWFKVKTKLLKQEKKLNCQKFLRVSLRRLILRVLKIDSIESRFCIMQVEVSREINKFNQAKVNEPTPLGQICSQATHL